MYWFATSAEYARLTDDDLLAVAAMRAEGLTVEPVVWGSYPLAMARGDTVVVRSCWDYHTSPVPFLAWLRALDAGGVRVLNDPGTIEWNLHKQYLLELQREHGVPIPRTVLVRQGQAMSLGEAMARVGTQDVVVKPAISLSAWNTHRFTRPDPASEATFEALRAGHDLLVQAYLPQIRDGEYSLVFFEGHYSHAVLKTPAPADFRVQRDHGGVHAPIEPDADVIAQAARALAATGFETTYARVDGVMAGPELVVMEIELIDPVLFLGLAQPSARTAFADAVQGVRRPVAV